jgi:hypothetical protein
VFATAQTSVMVGAIVNLREWNPSVRRCLGRGPMSTTPVGAPQTPSWADRFLIRSLLGCGKRGSVSAMFVSSRTRVERPEHWTNLTELREVALSKGCTLAQFQNAVETMGGDPRHVANYLQRHAFVAELEFENAQVA